MRQLALLSFMLVLAGSATILITRGETQVARHAHAVPADRENAPVDSIVQYLVSSAVSDFHSHGPSGPIRFRVVRLGHVTTQSGEKQYRLCGQFIRTEQGIKAQWTPFVTIKTSGFEQYIGAQAATFCRDSSITWDKVGDLSKLLQSRVDSLR